MSNDQITMGIDLNLSTIGLDSDIVLICLMLQKKLQDLLS